MATDVLTHGSPIKITIAAHGEEGVVTVTEHVPALIHSWSVHEDDVLVNALVLLLPKDQRVRDNLKLAFPEAELIHPALAYVADVPRGDPGEYATWFTS